jgi:hypothetical protein
MPRAETGTFTVGVFQDVSWAKRGLEALLRHGFVPEAITILAKEAPEIARLMEETLGSSGSILDLRGLGTVRARGPLVEALQGGDRDVRTVGLGAALTRAGFQPHDGFIFETLTGRGGVLVSVRSEPRAADALATLHAYGGGNAAIGAWVGRV